MDLSKLNDWRTLPCPKCEVQLDIVLAFGQSFRWTQLHLGIWCGVFSKKLWLLKQNEDEVMYQVFGDKSTDSAAELRDYLQLDVSINDLYKKWAKDDSVFSKMVDNKFHGIRVLRQDPVENLFSFICSSSNNIKRISSMVEELCVHYGEKIESLGEKTFHAFPTVQTLASVGVEAKLRDLKFGYHAGYISKTAQYINSMEEGEKWLYNLRMEPYNVARKKLQKLTGVGPKVADCVCLMSLDKPGAIPVDTHIQQIACREYLPSLKDKKSLTPKCYDQIATHFRNLWGEYCGWAQAVLFAIELRKPKEKDSVMKINEQNSWRKRRAFQKETANVKSVRRRKNKQVQFQEKRKQFKFRGARISITG